MKLAIHNFQSIDRLELELSPYSCLVGDSNIGKSAVVRAIRSMVNGSPVDQYIRHKPNCPKFSKGAKTCGCTVKVSLQYNGKSVEWEKGDTINQYTVNGKVFTAVGRGTPEFLKEWEPLMMGKSPVPLQIADQFNPIFLLDRSGSNAAEALGDLVQIDTLNAAIKRCGSDLRNTNNTVKIRTQDLKDLDVQIQTLSPIDSIDLTDLNDLENQIGDHDKNINGIENWITLQYSLQTFIGNWESIPKAPDWNIEPEGLLGLDDWIFRFQSHTGVVDQIQSIPPIPNPVAPDPYRWVLEWIQLQNSHIEVMVRLEPVLKIHIPDPIDPDLLVWLNGLVDQYAVHSDRVLRYEAIGSIPDPNGIIVLLRTLMLSNRSVETSKALERSTRYLTLSDISSDHLEAARRLYDQILDWVTRLQTIKQQWSAIKLNEERLTLELESIKNQLAQYNVCPVCAAPVGDWFSHEV